MSAAVVVDSHACTAAQAIEPACAESALLLGCVGRALDGESSPSLEQLFQAPVDWGRFLQLAQTNEVSAMTFQALSIYPERLPPPVLDELHGYALAAIAQHHALSSLLVEIVSWLQERAIPVVALKGPATATAIYKQPWLRHSGDLDLLVPAERAVEAKNLLLRRGFRVIRGLEPKDAGDLEKHFVLLNPAGTIVVELHWDFHEPAFHFRLDSREVFASAVPVALHGRAVPCASPEYLLLLLSVHGARHGWDSLKWICDIAELVRSQPAVVLERSRRRAVELGCERMLQLALRLSSMIFACDAPRFPMDWENDSTLEWLVERVRENILARGPAAADPAKMAAVNAQNFAFLLRCRESVGARVCLAWSHIASQAKPNSLDHAFIRLPRPLRLLYWIVRPFRILRTYGPGSILHAGALLLRSTSRPR